MQHKMHFSRRNKASTGRV